MNAAPSFQGTIYLSGPMTGREDFNRPAFRLMANRLRSLGHDVVNPAEIELVDPSWETCMRADIKALMDCQAVAVLPGWEASKGARVEVELAMRLGMPVVDAGTLAPIEAESAINNRVGDLTEALADLCRVFEEIEEESGVLPRHYRVYLKAQSLIKKPQPALT